MEIVKFYIAYIELMNPQSGKNDNNNKKDRTKAIAADIPMAGAIVTAAILLSGLSLIGSYQQPVIAQQQNMTGGAGGTTGGATTDNATTTMGGATQGGNATTAGGAGGNDSISQIRMHLEEARTALQNNDTQGAMMHLDLAINALGGAGGAQGNMTATTGGGNNMTTGGGGGGTEDGGPLEGIFGGGGQ
jgi:hypothetical protein